jgi:biotin carboxyl carrier protein
MGSKTYKVTSPVMGTFYRASAPGEKPLVEVGQKVNASDVVCMIESMKIFTELRADQAHENIYRAEGRSSRNCKKASR